MFTRRNFVRKVLTGVLGVGFLLDPFSPHARKARAQLAEDTGRDPLRNKDPKEVDTSNLEITPLKNFGTMGLDDYQVDTHAWRLVVDGNVENKLSLSYQELLELPTFEKPVLLICPGIFTNHGMWKGISVANLLKLAKVNSAANHVSFKGPEGNYEKVMRVPLNDVVAGKVFLAHHVNREPLPQKHGFPLRLVAECYYGHDWVKYVYKVTAEIVPD